MYLISIIIPVYNAEKYLKNAINSIINQTIGFEKIELLLIDDNSNDNSKKIIEEYAKKYDNIVAIYSKENHGFPGFGRNVGIKNATSDYIMFLDNDDEYDADMCKKLYDALIEEDADVATCNKIIVDFIGHTKNKVKYRNGTKKDNKVIIKDDDIFFYENISIWNKIYKKEVITKNNIKLLEDTTADDLVFTIEYFLNSKKLVYLENYFGYNWKINSESLSHSVEPEHIYELIKTYKYLCNIIILNNKNHLINQIMKNQVSYLILQSTYLKCNNHQFKKILNDIYEFEKEINFSFPLEEKWEDMINHLIMKKKFKIAILLLKSVDKLRESTILRKINRI
ncbi:glycosyltransferase [Methanobrevibacter sp.]|uniref:glycosyltransferase family 2 protein n=1 Tax=Methanobrevibacter sp. TaxID=66852 RepID=UPI00386FA0CC